MQPTKWKHTKKAIQPKPLDAWKQEEQDQHAEKSLSVFMNDEELVKAYIDRQTGTGTRELMAKTLELKGHGKRKEIARILDERRERPSEIMH